MGNDREALEQVLAEGLKVRGFSQWKMCKGADTSTMVFQVLDQVIAARDEARAFGEDVVKKYNELLKQVAVVTCAYCGQEYPRGTPRHGDGALAEHIKTCPQHPMRIVEAELAATRDDTQRAYDTANAAIEDKRQWILKVEQLRTDRDAANATLIAQTTDIKELRTEITQLQIIVAAAYEAVHTQDTEEKL